MITAINDNDSGDHKTPGDDDDDDYYGIGSFNNVGA